MVALSEPAIPAEPLPQAPGPKLSPFTPTAHADIEFLCELGGDSKDGRVWKVRINGLEPCYALKLFKFKSLDDLKEIANFEHPLLSPQFYNTYYDPFNCECRIYGRLKEEHREDLAVRAHGYLLLTPEQEAELTARISEELTLPPDDNVTDDEYVWSRREEHRHEPVRAIVKDFVSDSTPFTADQLPDLWADLENLHELGILVRDIGVFNYMGGKLVDFSLSWVMPHPSLQFVNLDKLDGERKSDPRDLRNAIVDWGIGNHWNWKEVVIPEELTRCASTKAQKGQYGTDPRLYDWRKWEEDTAPQDAVEERKISTRKRRLEEQ